MKKRENGHPADNDWDELGKPFPGPSGTNEGGGDEPASLPTYDVSSGVSADKEDDTCNKDTGLFLKGCVYLPNPDLLSENQAKSCTGMVTSLATKWVFGPVKSESVAEVQCTNTARVDGL